MKFYFEGNGNSLVTGTVVLLSSYNYYPHLIQNIIVTSEIITFKCCLISCKGFQATNIKASNIKAILLRVLF